MSSAKRIIGRNSPIGFPHRYADSETGKRKMQLARFAMECLLKSKAVLLTPQPHNIREAVQIDCMDLLTERDNRDGVGSFPLERDIVRP